MIWITKRTRRHCEGRPVTEEDWVVLLPEDLPIRYRGHNTESGESSIRCIPARKMATSPACPILPENIDREIARIRQSIFLLELQADNDPCFVPSHFFGPISSEQGKGTDAERVFVGCEAKQGNSGSPVISRVDGKVVGILRGSETSQAQGGKLVEEMNFFGPIRLAWDRFVEKPQ